MKITETCFHHPHTLRLFLPESHIAKRKMFSFQWYNQRKGQSNFDFTYTRAYCFMSLCWWHQEKTFQFFFQIITHTKKKTKKNRKRNKYLVINVVAELLISDEHLWFVVYTSYELLRLNWFICPIIWCFTAIFVRWN